MGGGVIAADLLTVHNLPPRMLKYGLFADLGALALLMSCRVFSSREEVVGVISSLFAFEEFPKIPPELDPKRAHLLHHCARVFSVYATELSIGVKILSFAPIFYSQMYDKCMICIAKD